MPNNPGDTRLTPRHWLQVSLTTNQPEPVEDLLLALGAQAVTLRDAADQALLEPLPGQTPMWDAVQVIGLFDGEQPAAALLDELQHSLDSNTWISCSTELIEDREWLRAWMDDFRPLQCGARLWICPSHHQVEVPGAVVVRLDPGLAFGTGSHPTTALCLQWLDQADLHGKTVIDYGCGSGILAVAAALLGADKVWAVDIDPQALEATRSNAEQNQVTARITPYLPEDLPPEAVADLVIANILARPLIDLAPVLLGHLRKSGQLVLAGLLNDQAADVMAAYAQAAALQPVSASAGWQLLAGVNHS